MRVAVPHGAYSLIPSGGSATPEARSRLQANFAYYFQHRDDPSIWSTFIISRNPALVTTRRSRNAWPLKRSRLSSQTPSTRRQPPTPEAASGSPAPTGQGRGPAYHAYPGGPLFLNIILIAPRTQPSTARDGRFILVFTHSHVPTSRCGAEMPQAVRLRVPY